MTEPTPEQKLHDAKNSLLMTSTALSKALTNPKVTPQLIQDCLNAVAKAQLDWNNALMTIPLTSLLGEDHAVE